MRKILVRIFNVIFIGCALFAAISLGISPLVKVNLTLNISEDNLYQMLVDNNIPTNLTTKSEDKYKVPSRLTEDEEIDILDKLTAERIVYGTDKTAGVGKIEGENFTIELPLNSCFHPKNEKVLKDFVDTNIDEITKRLAEIVTPKLKIVIRAVAMEVASEVIKDKMQEQIDHYFDETSGADHPFADQTMVNAIVDNVYDLFDQNPTTTVGQLSNVLAGTSEYVVADPQPTDAEHGNYSYYTLEGDTYVEFTGESFDAGTTYYKIEYGPGVYGALQDLQEANVPGFENISYEDVDTTDIENKMVEALQTMPGLTDYKLADPQPRGLISDSKQNYYVKVSEDKYEKVVGSEGETFDPSKEYYEIIILNVDAALIGLMDYYFKTTTTRAIKRDEVAPAKAETSEGKLILTVQEKIKSLLPLGTIDRLTDKSVNKVTPLLFTAYFVLLVFPWALFGLITFIRLFRKNKCWTKLWVVYVFAFIQLILGFVLTIGFAKFMPKLIDVVAGRLPAKYQTYGNVIKDSPISIRTNCFVASYVYVEMIVLGIIYAIIAHRLKVTNKMVRRIEKHEKKETARMYQQQNQVVYNYPSYIAYPPYPYPESRDLNRGPRGNELNDPYSDPNER